MTFETLGLCPELLRAVRDLGFAKPTEIQQGAIPSALQGKDILARAMTGSGKTAAFLLPILDRLIGSQGRGPRALIITPTRELAVQITSDMKDLSAHTRLRGATIIGGVGMRPQERAFGRGNDVIVATPGRLLDHLRHPQARLDSIEMLVLDEADRMLDMGFLPDVRRILGHLPKDRQTMFFSATMPPPIAKLANEMLYSPVTISVDREAAPPDTVRHRVFPVEQSHKSRLLLDIMGRDGVDSVLAFTRTKHRANRLALFLEQNGVPAERIHGNRSQSQRQSALDSFKRGRTRILVATDIAARGIDIKDLSHVINFDVPHLVEDYIHRVGRTARAGRSGDAFTFVAPDEHADMRAIERALGKRLDREHPAKGEHPVQPERPLQNGHSPQREHAAQRKHPAPRGGPAPRRGRPAQARTGGGPSSRPKSRSRRR